MLPAIIHVYEVLQPLKTQGANKLPKWVCFIQHKQSYFFSVKKLTSQQSGNGQMNGDRLLGDFIWPRVEDVFAHVAVSRLAVKGLVSAAQQRPMTLLEGQQQNSFL